MSTFPRHIPTTFLGLPPLGALVKAAFQAPPKKAKPTRKAEGSIDMNKLLAAAKVAPDLSIIEWDGDRARPVAAAQEAPAARASHAGDACEGEGFDAHALDPRQRKIRERYIGARFPGVARTPAELQSSDRVIKAARLYFEDEQPELALELLELAAQEAPHESPLWLARLEILFLARDAEGFVQAARAFRQAHAQHDAWPEVERLGRALVPGEALFGETSGPRDHEHYGPWPHLPNWIQAPWDLTAEITAADFHHSAMRLHTRTANAA